MNTEHYEISIWETYYVAAIDDEHPAHYDERKLAVIGSDTMTADCRAYEPKLVENINGTKTFTFKMHLWYLDQSTGARIENPFLNLLVNERLVKVKWKGEWYDFVIKNIQEDSSNKSITYSCKDLFVSELSKTGFNIEFDNELQNNQGTVYELAEETLKGTDWKLDESNQILQKKIEDFYDTELDCAIQALCDDTGESMDLSSGRRILPYYSTVNTRASHCGFFIPDMSGNNIDIDPTTHLVKGTGVYVENVTWEVGTDGISISAYTSQATPQSDGEYYKFSAPSRIYNGNDYYYPYFSNYVGIPVGYKILIQMEVDSSNPEGYIVPFFCDDVNRVNRYTSYDSWISVGDNKYKIWHTVTNEFTESTRFAIWFKHYVENNQTRTYNIKSITFRLYDKNSNPVWPDEEASYLEPTITLSQFICQTGDAPYLLFSIANMNTLAQLNREGNRIEHLVWGTESVYDPLTKQYCDVYIAQGPGEDNYTGLINTGDEIYGYKKSVFNSPTAVTNFVVNSNNFKDLNGWKLVKEDTYQADLMTKLYPNVSGDLKDWNGNSYLYFGLSDSGQYLYNKGFSQAGNYFPNGFAVGDKLQFRIQIFKGNSRIPEAPSAANISNLLNFVICDFDPITFHPIMDGESAANHYFDPTTIQYTGDGWYSTEFTCLIPCTYQQLIDGTIGLFIWCKQGYTYWLQEAQLYPTIYDENGNIIELGQLDTSTVHEIQYSYYNHTRTLNTPILDNTSLLQGASALVGQYKGYPGTITGWDLTNFPNQLNTTLKQQLTSVGFKNPVFPEDIFTKAKNTLNFWDRQPDQYAQDGAIYLEFETYNEVLSGGYEYYYINSFSSGDVFNFWFNWNWTGTSSNPKINPAEYIIPFICEKDNRSKIIARCDTWIGANYDSEEQNYKSWHCSLTIPSNLSSDLNINNKYAVCIWFRNFKQNTRYCIQAIRQGDTSADNYWVTHGQVRRYIDSLTNVNNLSYSNFQLPTYALENPADIQYLYQGTSPWDYPNMVPKSTNYNKIRSISIKNSNRFNILQTIAETFECWCIFNISHDETGKITSKTITFRENVGQETGIGFIYGIDLKSIKRTIQSDQIVTKTIVPANNNEVALNGFCTIARSPLNYIADTFIFNLEYYCNNGLIDRAQLYNDLYDASNGYFTQLHTLNPTYSNNATRLIELYSERDKYKAYQTTYKGYKEALDTQITNLKDGIAKLANRGTFAQVAQTDYESSSDIQSRFETLQHLQGELKEYESLLTSATSHLEGLIPDIQNLEATQKALLDRLNELHEEFYHKYWRFLQEGSWNDDKYYDDNLYYLDATSVAQTSGEPKITYDISVMRISALEEFKNKVFRLGDISYVQDPSFFGYIEINGIKTPYKERVILSEITSNFDEPSKDTIKVQNYRTQFQDLFHRITATTQSLQYASGQYARAARAMNTDGSLKASTLQQSFTEDPNVTYQAQNESFTWDMTGITVTDALNPNQKTKLAPGGLLMSNDGGATWTTVVGADGIRPEQIGLGQIDASTVSFHRKGKERAYPKRETEMIIANDGIFVNGTETSAGSTSAIGLFTLTYCDASSSGYYNLVFDVPNHQIKWSNPGGQGYVITLPAQSGTAMVTN